MEYDGKGNAYWIRFTRLLAWVAALGALWVGVSGAAAISAVPASGSLAETVRGLTSGAASVVLGVVLALLAIVFALLGSVVVVVARDRPPGR